jgi:hypothetical protein
MESKLIVMLTTLLISITVHASVLPLETTEKIPLSSQPTISSSKVNFKPTLTQSANGNDNFKPDNEESTLKITLDMNEEEKEVVDKDMGKYLGESGG